MTTPRLSLKHALLLAGTFAFLLPALTQAQTHMGQPPNNHVTLVGAFDPESPCDSTEMTLYKKRPDGLVSPKPFIVASTQFFMLTDISWIGQRNSSQSSLLQRGYSQVNLVGHLSGGSSTELWEGEPIFLFEPDVWQNGGRQSSVSGIRLAPNRVYCIGAFHRTQTSGVSISTQSMRVLSVQAEGYLIDKNP